MSAIILLRNSHYIPNRICTFVDYAQWLNKFINKCSAHILRILIVQSSTSHTICFVPSAWFITNRLRSIMPKTFALFLDD